MKLINSIHTLWFNNDSDEQDIGIVIEGDARPISMVTVNKKSLVTELRDAIALDGEINFKFKFVHADTSYVPFISSYSLFSLVFLFYSFYFDCLLRNF